MGCYSSSVKDSPEVIAFAVAITVGSDLQWRPVVRQNYVVRSILTFQEPGRNNRATCSQSCRVCFGSFGCAEGAITRSSWRTSPSVKLAIYKRKKKRSRLVGRERWFWIALPAV